MEEEKKDPGSETEETEAPPTDTFIGTRPESAPEETREWKTGLFQFNCKQCVLGYFCLPCQAAKVGKKLGENCGFCVACYFLGALRARFRTKHGIKGSICHDGYMSVLCTPCALWQLEREMESLGI